jgi:dihydrofolate synthase/folylpolyglutamate synthase
MASPALAARIASLQRRAQRGMALGLDRVEEALARLGSPHRGLLAVHVAGTNGKGSVSAMTESIARAAGLRTGLYTSPHLCRIAERIRLDGEPIDDDALARVLGLVEDRCEVPLTFFELLTIAAFTAFAEAGVDVAVLEVGLGGRLDATNVIKAPVATAVTSIAFDHTEWLGETLAAIAREKAGIFKPGAPVVLGPLEEEADRAIEEAARAVGAAPIVRVTRSDPAAGKIAVREEGGLAVITPPPPFAEARARLALPGAHQVENAAVAAGLAWQMAARWPAVAAAIPDGIAGARWPGRMERIERDGVTVILDCAHNPHGAAALAAALRREGIDPGRSALVFGALADKRWREALAILAGTGSRRYYAEPRGRAPAPLDALREAAPGEAVGDPRAAVRRALAESRPGDTVIVTGSIYLVGEVRAELLGIESDPVIAL